ncbi:MAG: hypothetical protein WBW32_01305 [Luteibacter sp.]
MNRVILAGLCLAMVGCATGEKMRRLDLLAVLHGLIHGRSAECPAPVDGVAIRGLLVWRKTGIQLTVVRLVRLVVDVVRLVEELLVRVLQERR